MADPTDARMFWAQGDYEKVAELIRDLGTQLVTAAGIGPGDRVLDVAAGTGNATLPAARTGASVTATDLTPELLAAGARAARAEGLDIRWVEGDAKDLPFADEEFDVVISAIGAMFAPDHRRTATELLRVCRPGGTIALASWTPDGAVGHFFGLLAPYLPSPPNGAQPPTRWGDPAHVRDLCGSACDRLDSTVRVVRARFEGTPEELIGFYRRHFAPVIVAFETQRDDPERSAALHRELLDFAQAENSGPPGGPGRFDFEYLLTVGRRRGPGNHRCG